MTTTGDDTSPGLRFTVYRVNPETLDRTPATTRTLPASDGPMTTSVYPPCECPRCKARPA